ncbi:hypothetical protein [Dysgonomonas sp. 520]|uniref:hypothetical protein n=1 Tax=Dysgonomonas sp. 520 TaxID=2302931 RepID=UPI0013D6C7F5|nr:hypothetical protein [Dysgonomonas sp. 520]NDW09272.1 hypothetical protein [Dysgonomonas sp. 520]
MKKYRNLIYYISVIGVLCIIMYVIFFFGESNLEAHRQLEVVTSQLSAWKNFTLSVFSEATGSVAILLLQIIVILMFVRLFGWICQKIGLVR